MYPQAALPTGALRPFGDYKGGGLALMCELLAGAVGGGGTIQPGNERTDHIIVSTAPEHSTAQRSITALSPVFCG